MEITPSPHRPATTPWGRLLLLVVVVAPVSILVLLPSGLGLQRYVVTGSSMAGDRPDSIARGSLVLERLVPLDELRVGDVITFRAPAGSGVTGTLTQRIVSAGSDGFRTQGDADPAPAPWTLRPRAVVVPRVVLTVPAVGYAYLALGDWRFWAGAVALVGLGVAATGWLTTRHDRRRRANRRDSAPPAAPDLYAPCHGASGARGGGRGGHRLPARPHAGA